MGRKCVPDRRVDFSQPVDPDRAVLAGLFDQIVQAPVINAGGLQMRNHIGCLEYRSHRIFRVISNGVALFNRHCTIHFNVEFHEHTISAISSPDVMNASDTFTTEHSGADPLPVRCIEFPIE
jgi:hypothetical protein